MAEFLSPTVEPGELDRIQDAIDRPLPLLQATYSVGAARGSAREIGTTVVQYLGSMFDAREAKRISLEVISTMDVNTSIQLIGAFNDSSQDANFHHAIGPVRNLPNDDRMAINIDMDAVYFPWYGITVTPVSGATRGEVSAIGHIQR